MRSHTVHAYRSGFNRRQWLCELSCGHELWVRGDRAPKTVQCELPHPYVKPAPTREKADSERLLNARWRQVVTEGRVRYRDPKTRRWYAEQHAVLILDVNESERLAVSRRRETLKRAKEEAAMADWVPGEPFKTVAELVGEDRKAARRGSK